MTGPELDINQSHTNSIVSYLMHAYQKQTINEPIDADGMIEYLYHNGYKLVSLPSS